MGRFEFDLIIYWIKTYLILIDKNKMCKCNKAKCSLYSCPLRQRDNKWNRPRLRLKIEHIYCQKKLRYIKTPVSRDTMSLTQRLKTKSSYFVTHNTSSILWEPIHLDNLKSIIESELPKWVINWSSQWSVHHYQIPD